MSQQYVSPFSEKVAEVCAAHHTDCTACPIGECGRQEGDSAIEHVKRVNAKAEEAGE